jgi:HAD superfamily hydrolase (TIGR01490 family)
MRKVAIFDIDGTIFRSSLLIELTEALIQGKIFPAKIKKSYRRFYNQWLNRQGPYEEYIRAVICVFEQSIKGVRQDLFLKIAKQTVNFHQNRVYRYTRDLVKDLKKKNYFILAISNSPKIILDEFCRKLGFNKVYGRLYRIVNGRFTGETEYPELISDKAKILKRAVQKENLTLKDSIGVGDTESDIRFLKLVEKPICFNPNQKLYQYAKRRGWLVIVERKDVIYYL